ncbi:MAG: diguanylate cyclase [Candidatus Dormibacteraeota bacterium]|nr:diguanylate cyclase [Candidatus Dormibacteraeota bacterium]
MEVAGGHLNGVSRVSRGIPRTMAAVWRRSSFSVKFAGVLLITGLVISAVPLWLSQNSTNSQSLDRAADKAGVAANLIQQQRASLAGFTTGVARQVAELTPPATYVALEEPLKQDASVNQTGDVVGVILPDGGVVAYGADGLVAQSDPLLLHLTDGVSAGRSMVADDSGQPWLLAYSPVAGSGAVAFTGRQMTTTFITAIDRNIATTADPADLIVVRNGRIAVQTTFVGAAANQGSGVAPSIHQAVSSGAPQLATLNQTSVALAAQPLSDGFSVAVATPVSAVTAAVTPLLVLVALILLAMLIIVAVVQSELQRPLRRLDRAVAALGRSDFDAPLPLGRDDELGRLAETFDAMRTQLRATIRASASRAAVATELSSSQPLETTLSRVVNELRSAVHADSALILVTRSEMSDSFAIVEGVGPVDVDSCLAGDGPLGVGYRQDGGGALLASSTPSSREAQLGMRELCVSPLRIGAHVHGVLAVANHSRAFLPSDVELVGSLAEQVALALERYRFLAMVQRQASTDDLTGLYNHRFLVDYLGQQVALAERLNAPLAVLMLDIDFFKKLNDTHGHQAGDAALAAFAQTLLHSVRTSDLAARYGGEEFAVVMYNTGSSEARLVAEKIRKAVSQTIIELPDHSRLAVTVSIGGAAFPEDTSSARELLALADEALYRAKGGGRDRTCMVSDDNHRGRAA